MATTVSSESTVDGLTIYLQPTEVWGFWLKNQERLEETEVLIAENSETEYGIYITEDDGMPNVLVYRCEDQIYEEGIVSESDCRRTIKQMYTKYLFPVTIVSGQGSEVSAIADDADAGLDNGRANWFDDDDLTEDEWHAYVEDMERHDGWQEDNDEPEQYDDQEALGQALEDEVYERDDQLLCGLVDFLDVALEAETIGHYFEDLYDDELQTILDEVLVVVASHGLSVRRPTFVKNSDGTEEFIEYPYEDEVVDWCDTPESDAIDSYPPEEELPM